MSRRGEALAADALETAEGFARRPRGRRSSGKVKPGPKVTGPAVWSGGPARDDCCASPGEPAGKSIFVCPKGCKCHRKEQGK